MPNKRSPGCGCCGGCGIFNINQDSEQDVSEMDGQVTWSGTGPFVGLLAPGEWVEAIATIPSSELTNFELEYDAPDSGVSEHEATDLPVWQTFNIANGSVNVTGMPVLTGADTYSVEHEFEFKVNANGDLANISGDFSRIAGNPVSISDFPGFTYSGLGPVTRTVAGSDIQDPNGLWEYGLTNANYLSSNVQFISWKITLTSSTGEGGDKSTYSKPFEFTITARDAGNKGWTTAVSFVRDELFECETVEEYDSLNVSQPTGFAYEAEYVVKDVFTCNYNGTESPEARNTVYPPQYRLYYRTDDPGKTLWYWDNIGSIGDVATRFEWKEGRSIDPMTSSTHVGLDWISKRSSHPNSYWVGMSGLDLWEMTEPWDRSTNYDLKVRLTNDSDTATMNVLEMFATRARGIQSGDDGYYDCGETPPSSDANSTCPLPIAPCPDTPDTKFLLTDINSPVLDWIPAADIRDTASYWIGERTACYGYKRQHCDFDGFKTLRGDIDISGLDLTPPTPTIDYVLVTDDSLNKIEEWTYTWAIPAAINVIDSTPWSLDEGGKLSCYMDFALEDLGDGTHRLTGNAMPWMDDSPSVSEGGPDGGSSCPPAPISDAQNKPYSFLDVDPNTGPTLLTNSDWCLTGPTWVNGDGVIDDTRAVWCESAPFDLCTIADQSEITLDGVGPSIPGATPTITDRIEAQLKWCIADSDPFTRDCSVSTVTCVVRKVFDKLDFTTIWSVAGGNGLGVVLELEDLSTTRTIDPLNCSFKVKYEAKP